MAVAAASGKLVAASSVDGAQHLAEPRVPDRLRTVGAIFTSIRVGGSCNPNQVVVRGELRVGILGQRRASLRVSSRPRLGQVIGVTTSVAM